MNEKGDIVKDMWQQLRTGFFISTTYFFSPKERLRMTVKRHNKKIPKKDQEYILSYGRPNYREREFIKKFPDLKWMFKDSKNVKVNTKAYGLANEYKKIQDELSSTWGYK